jgi:hypothetical protein
LKAGLRLVNRVLIIGAFDTAGRIRGGGRRGPTRFNQVVVVVAGVNYHADADLAEIVHARSFQGPLLGARQRWEQHRREDGNNRNDHQKFDQGKTRGACTS